MMRELKLGRGFRALMLVMSLAWNSMSACAKEQPPPPIDDTQQESRSDQRAPTGMSTGKKVVLLAGAAALYYLYKHHQQSTEQTGPGSQYYLSKNGRVYYRDAEHRAHWVTAPTEGISVPVAAADEYRDFQGYDNRQTGRDLSGLASDPE